MLPRLACNYCTEKEKTFTNPLDLSNWKLSIPLLIPCNLQEFFFVCLSVIPINVLSVSIHLESEIPVKSSIENSWNGVVSSKSKSHQFGITVTITNTFSITWCIINLWIFYGISFYSIPFNNYNLWPSL